MQFPKEGIRAEKTWLTIELGVEKTEAKTKHFAGPQIKEVGGAGNVGRRVEN